MSENDLLIYINHLDNLEEDWESIFYNLQGMVVSDYVISPFECTIGLTDLEPNLDEQLFELHTDLEAKSLLTRSGFCSLWSSGLVTKRYVKIRNYYWIFISLAKFLYGRSRIQSYRYSLTD